MRTSRPGCGRRPKPRSPGVRWRFPPSKCWPAGAGGASATWSSRTCGLLRNTTHGEALPAVFLHPHDWNGTTVLWVHGRGKAGLYSGPGAPAPAVRRLVASGVSVMGADLLFQGEFLKPGQTRESTRRVSNQREFAGYTFGYNDALPARRVQDVRTALRFVRTDDRKSAKVVLVGTDGMGPVAGLAAALAGDWVDAAALDTGGFRFAGVRDLHSPEFLPGGARYGDLPGLLALAAPRPLFLAGEGLEVPAVLADQYGKHGAGSRLLLHAGAGEGVDLALATWLLGLR